MRQPETANLRVWGLLRWPAAQPTVPLWHGMSNDATSIVRKKAPSLKRNAKNGTRVVHIEEAKFERGAVAVAYMCMHVKRFMSLPCVHPCQNIVMYL